MTLILGCMVRVLTDHDTHTELHGQIYWLTMAPCCMVRVLADYDHAICTLYSDGAKKYNAPNGVELKCIGLDIRANLTSVTRQKCRGCIHLNRKVCNDNIWIYTLRHLRACHRATRTERTKAT